MSSQPQERIAVLRTYTIFDHPVDHPDSFVIRGFDLLPGANEPIPTPDCLTFPNILAARLWVIFNEPDKICITRTPEDDPVIVETWV